jgi:hypothetical protein
MHIGEMASCKECRAEVVVPSDSVETAAVEPKRPPTHESPGVGPPTAPAGPTPTFRLYSLGAMIVGTLVGSMFVGLLLISKNFTALGDENRARRSFWLGVAGTVVVFAAAFALPEQTPKSVFEAAQIGVVTWYANREQGKMIEAHKALGGTSTRNGGPLESD